MLPDYSCFLSKEDNFEKEEAAWHKANEEGTGHRAFAEAVNKLYPKSVIEFGCGTGWTAQKLICKHYLGVDANLRCLQLACKRVPRGEFIHADIREYAQQHFPQADVVLSTAFLKHFGLHEWDDIFQKFLSFGKEYAVFTMQIAMTDFDDGVEYPHTWLTREHLEKQLSVNGFELIEEIPSAVCELGIEPIFIAKRV